MNGELIITKRTKGKYSPNRFDVVVIRDSFEDEFITKRVIGLPGEKLEMVRGKIYINN